MGQFQVPKIQNSRIPALSKVHNQEMIGERLVLYCPTKLDRYDLADPSLSPRRSTDSSALLEREGAGCAVEKKEWRNPISGACCQLSGLQWNIGLQIKTSIEEKSENSKH